MAVSNLGTLAVYLTAQTGQFNNALRKARMSIAAFSGIVKTGIAASVATMGVLAVKGVQAYAEQEDAVNNLNAALSANGDSIDRYSQKFQDFASKMQSQTIFGDEATLETMTYGRNLGIVASKLEEATTAAAGLAAKYNIDLNSAMQLIGRASQGQTGTLARYGIILDDTLSKEEKFNQLLKIGVSNFSLAEAKANTFSGKMKQLSNAWGDMLEEVGKSIVEGANFKMMIDSAIKKIQKLTQRLKSIGGEASYMMQEITIYVKSSIDAISTVFKPFGTMAG
ncbi:MAG TPA: phage tail tape measure protein, partial [Candidatus Wallbacteria bacterium]|nr:phage tail tape measure protein [Candidatus Wallbacteria bacterium]